MESAMKSIFARLIRDESGTTAIEYAVIASVISVFCLTLPTLLGAKMNLKFTSVSNALN
jgi:pilus assembly protein Flp/PilA